MIKAKEFFTSYANVAENLKTIVLETMFAKKISYLFNTYPLQGYSVATCL